MTQARRRTGARGEAAVASWYEARGYEVLARNWTCREGELDLVVRNGRTYVFCEVKTRASDAFGAPAEAVNRDKQRRLRRLATRWLEQAAVAAAAAAAGREIRFDVAAVLGDEIEVLEGAF